MTENSKRRRRRSKLPVRRRDVPAAEKPQPVRPGFVGGQYKPFTDTEVQKVHQTVLDLMEKVGFADATPSMIKHVTAAGGWMDEHERLCFPRGLVEDTIANVRRKFVLYGRNPKHDLEIGGSRVHLGTAGASPNMLDFEKHHYRRTTLVDLYDISRLVDTLDNIHFYYRSVVATDMPTMLDVDINTSYACLAATEKHIGVSYVGAKNTETAIELFDTFLGGEGEFSKRPFCSSICTHVVPPMRFAQEAIDSIEVSARVGMPAMVLSAGQAGATSPAALAGSVVQSVAEVLGGIVFAMLVNPQCRVIFGTWPFVSDLRTGAMSGGSAELSLAAAACAQMAAFYDLPGAVAAGFTDSKLPDAQSGAEKALTLSLAAQAGSSMITESAGMHASLLGVSLESYVIDNDMLGSVQRTVRGIEVSEDSLSFELIRETVLGEGHFLGSSQTIDRMESDYFYPLVGDRTSPGEWEDNGAKTVRDRAREHVRKVLKSHYPTYIDPAVDRKIRDKFNIMISTEAMKKGNGRW